MSDDTVTMPRTAASDPSTWPDLDWLVLCHWWLKPLTAHDPLQGVTVPMTPPFDVSGFDGLQITLAVNGESVAAILPSPMAVAFAGGRGLLSTCGDECSEELRLEKSLSVIH